MELSSKTINLISSRLSAFSSKQGEAFQMGDFMENSVDALDLYAKIEDLIGVKEVAPRLYGYYFDILNKLEFNSLLDIGCGRGDFLLNLKSKYSNLKACGIDRSPLMINYAIGQGVKAYNKELKELNLKVDIATATFDMVNYLTPDEFIEFFKDLKEVVKEGGYFVFDVNTEFGLGDLAVGNFIAEDKNRFLAIESFYENGLYESTFTLFEKEQNCYKKSSENIKQFHYNEVFFEMLGGWELAEKLPIKLYELEKEDKIIYILKSVRV